MGYSVKKADVLQSFIDDITSVYKWDYEGGFELAHRAGPLIETEYGKGEWFQHIMKYRKMLGSNDPRRYERIANEIRLFLLALFNERRTKIPQYPFSTRSSLANQTKPTFLQVENFNMNEVFVVHGHDSAARETVARFIVKVGLKAIILHEQPNVGTTIIEKFENNSKKVVYAVIVLTPDDFGNAADNKKNRFRARQKAIFELGFSLPNLGWPGFAPC